MRILIVDDEKNIRESIAGYLRLEDLEVLTAGDGPEALRILEESPVEAAVVDLRMPGMDGFQLLERLREERPGLPVIMISAYGEVRDAVEAMKAGARDYIVKPFDPEELSLKLARLREELALRGQAEQGRLQALKQSDGIGETPSTRFVWELVRKVASTPSTVLITGESGTGKEVIARALHHLSGRAPQPFVPVNIAGIPETLLDSELFGFEKGAFTGASERKPGIIETASGGTLFLDEIGDLGLSLQVKLLRVLQDKKIQHLGATRPIPVDLRILAATNRDLEARVRDGSFREDLYYRLNVIRISLPPLRERREDIPLLAGYFIERLNRELGKAVQGLDPAAMQALLEYRFPGNIRELENLLERAVLLAEGPNLALRDLNLPAPEAGRNGIAGPAPEAAEKPAPTPGRWQEVQRETIREALRRWKGNRTRAALDLGISRRTLQNKIKEYGL